MVSFFVFFSIWISFHEHSRFVGQQGKGEGIYLTPHYHFHSLHRHLDISRVITAESSPLHIAGSRTRLFSRSKLVPDSMSQPRAELFAAVLNAHTGEVVKRSLGKYHQSSTKLTDSQIALHWISNSDKPLKQWVRNRVIEIR